MLLLHAAAGRYCAGKWKESKGNGCDLLQVTIRVFDVQVTVHRDKFL